MKFILIPTGELQFMSNCATLDRAKITYAEAAEQRVNLLRRLRGRDWSPADIEAYDRFVNASQERPQRPAGG